MAFETFEMGYQSGSGVVSEVLGSPERCFHFTATEDKAEGDREIVRARLKKAPAAALVWAYLADVFSAAFILLERGVKEHTAFGSAQLTACN